MSATTASANSTFSTAHFTGSPASTFAGVGLLLATVGQAVASGPMPTTTSGWVSFGITALMGIASMFARG